MDAVKKPFEMPVYGGANIRDVTFDAAILTLDRNGPIEFTFQGKRQVITADQARSEILSSQSIAERMRELYELFGRISDEEKGLDSVFPLDSDKHRVAQDSCERRLKGLSARIDELHEIDKKLHRENR